jgi:hypothetical protein
MTDEAANAAPGSPADRESWQYGIRLALQLLTAHHPLCTWFKDDHYRWLGRRWCRGCVAALPTLLLGIVLAALFILQTGTHPYLLAATGLLLGVPHGTTYLKRFTKNYRAFAKLTGGLGLGLLVCAILLSPQPTGIRLTILGGLGACFLLLQGLRMRRMLKTCDQCPWQRNWAQCPGFEA